MPSPFYRSTLKEPYSGSQRKLLLAFDVGTTLSTVSYSILDPGKVPEIQCVQRFPASGNASIPTVMFYSKDGRVRAAGAETERDGIDVIAEEEDWVKAEWFTLYLKPASTAVTHLPPLPLGKSAVEIISDFLIYLDDCAKRFIQQTHPDVGGLIWSQHEIHYILSHSNSWEGPQQALMKQAAERAGLMNHKGGSQLSFITEGEASLHRCIDCGLGGNWIERSEGVSLVQAGKGILNISAWASEDDGRTFKEVTASQCLFKGSTFVTQAARVYLEEFLKGSRFHMDIPEMIRYFNMTTQPAFQHPDQPSYGSPYGPALTLHATSCIWDEIFDRVLLP